MLHILVIQILMVGSVHAVRKKKRFLLKAGSIDLHSKNCLNRQNLKLKLHVKLCEACKSLGQDSKLIDEAVEKIISQKAMQKMSLTEDQRAKILKALH